MEVKTRPPGNKKSLTPKQTTVSFKPGAPNLTTGKHLPKRVLVGVFFQKFGFISVGTMFVVMVFFTGIMTWVAWNEPHLNPSVVDNVLHQDTVYIKFDDENIYHELARTTESAQLDPSEVMQIPTDRPFEILVTAKRLTLPEDYHVSILGQGPNNTNLAYTELDKRVTIPKGTDFQLLTIFPPSGPWKPGRYELNFPDAANMFGGQFFAYLTVYEPGKPPPA